MTEAHVKHDGEEARKWREETEEMPDEEHSYCESDMLFNASRFQDARRVTDSVRLPGLLRTGGLALLLLLLLLLSERSISSRTPLPIWRKAMESAISTVVRGR